MVLEAARYKRRWNLRLMGLPEKEDEKVRDAIIGILTRVIPVSVDELRHEGDTVHRLGTRAPGNTMPRPVIMQFVRRTMRDEVWKMSREAKVCKEMRITFKQDFSKEDREARQKLWPRVEEARRRSVRAYLRGGYVIIDGKKIYPWYSDAHNMFTRFSVTTGNCDWNIESGWARFNLDRWTAHSCVFCQFESFFTRHFILVFYVIFVHFFKR